MGNPERRAVGRRRADAARNLDLLLRAARELIDQSGTDLVMDEVARRAGVGNATLYRNFPTRADLLVAVYQDEIDELCQLGSDLLAAPSPAEALFTWIDSLVVHIATKRALALAATDGTRRSELFDLWHAAIGTAMTALVARAHQVGALQPDVNPIDLLALVNGAALAATDPEHARRIVSLARRGIATE